jgi:hypothetical protein
MNAEFMMLLGGTSAFILNISWVRARELREKYALGWILMASALLVCGLYPRLIMVFAEAARLGYSSAVLWVALTAIYGYSFAVSVALSRLHRRSIRLMQEMALLEQRLRRLEQDAASAGNRATESDEGGSSLAA